MKHIFKIFYLLIIIALVSNCAKTGRPEGGPKDETPPLFVSSAPPFKAINFKKKEVKLFFNEYVKLKDLNKQLIVSPPLKNPLLITPQGSASKVLKIEILDTLNPNTTYIFNFGNAVLDNNENNILESFKYVFSTGSYIDSLSLSGNISDAFLNKKPKNTNIALYRLDSTYTDSIIYKKKPNYVANALDTNAFKFTNLKEGKYMLLALEEKSSDYIFDPKFDKIGLYLDTIVLPKDSLLLKPIRLFKEVLPYSFVRAKEVFKGKIEFGYQGIAKNLKVELLTNTPKKFKSISKLAIDKDTLNYWFTPIDADSLNFVVSNQTFIDSVTVKLNKKKIDSLKLTSTTRNILHFRDTFFIKSNNPIIKIDSSKILFTNKDTLKVSFKNYLSKKDNKVGFIFEKQQEENYTIKAFPGAFEDIYNTPNDSLSFNFKTKQLEDYGKITLNIINPKSENLIVELISKSDKSKIIETQFINNSGKLVFNLLEPKTYIFRAIIDSNNNKKWDTGNYLEKKLPEQVIYYEEELELRANYFLENTFTIKN